MRHSNLLCILGLMAGVLGLPEDNAHGHSNQQAHHDSGSQLQHRSHSGNAELDSRDAAAMALMNDDWTRWACTRGVQWACQYPEFAERDIEDPSEDTEEINTSKVVFAPPKIFSKRDDIAHELSEVVTVTKSAQGQVYTAEETLVTTSPAYVYVARMHASGTTITVVASQIATDPNLVAQTLMAGPITTVYTKTMLANPTSAATMTSVNLKRHHAATASPTAIAQNIEEQIADLDMPSVEHSEQLLEDTLEKMKDARDLDQLETMTYLDEHPGYTTLNPHVKFPFTGVTVQESSGTWYTLSATTDTNGKPSVVTKGSLKVSAEGTVSVMLAVDDSESTVIDSVKNGKGKHKVTEAAKVLKPEEQSTLTVEAPTIEAPIPKVAIPSQGALTLNQQIMTENGTVTKIITETVTKFRPATGPQATLFPQVWDPQLGSGWEHIMRENIDHLKERHPQADWDGKIAQMARPYRAHDPEITEEDGLKYAFIMLHKKMNYHDPYPLLSTEKENVVTQFLAKIHGTTLPITAPVQTIDGQRYFLDPLLKYKKFDPFSHNVAPTGSCHHDDDDDDASFESHHFNKKECAIERCMWDFMKPIKILTATPMAMFDEDSGDVIYDYFTHTTELHRQHWGTRENYGIYYPLTTTTLRHSGNATRSVVRATPSFHHHEQRFLKIHGDPSCTDAESCHAQCVHDPHQKIPFFQNRTLMAAAIGTGGLMMAVLVCCCCFCCFRRGKKDKTDRRRSSIADKLRRKSTEKPTPEVVVNQVTGEATDANGNPVDPNTAPTTGVAAGPAAGAAAAGQRGGEEERSGDDGRGTTGRRAEEGRGRVNFADQPSGEPNASGEATTKEEVREGKPSGEANAKGEAKPSGETTTTKEVEAKPANEGESREREVHEHAEPQPVPDKDGAQDRRDSIFGAGTGRQGPDAGSVRGRKRNRPEGIAGLGF